MEEKTITRLKKTSQVIIPQKLSSLIKKSDDVCYGFDYLKINLKGSRISSLGRMISVLDTDNTNYHGLEIIHNDNLYSLSINKVQTKFGFCLQFNISIDDIPYNIGQYLEYDERNSIMLKTMGSIDLYGAYFQLIRLGKIGMECMNDILRASGASKEDMEVYNKSNITRGDYKIDLCMKEKRNVPTPKKILNIRGNSKINMHYDGGSVTNWIYGNKSNKYVAIRMYDKLLDTHKKNKQSLYLDFLGYGSVHRLELQGNHKFTQARGGYNISQLDKLEKQFLEYMGLEEKTGNFKVDYGESTMFDYYDEIKQSIKKAPT